MGLEKVKDEIIRCVGCAECMGRGPHLPWADGAETVSEWNCPTLELFNFSSYGWKSRMYLARAIYYENFPITSDLLKIVYTCTGCGMCGTVCPRPIFDIIRAMRREIVERKLGPPESNRKLDGNIQSKHNLFGARENMKAKWSEEFKLPNKGDTLYFAGCYASYRYPHIAKSAAKVLKAAGVNVAYLREEEWCCGIHSGWDGNQKIQVEMANHNLKAIKDSGAKRIVFSCAECYRTLKKDYPVIGELPCEVMHIVEFIAELIKDGKIKFEKEIKKKIVYHDPCHLIRQHLGRRGDICDEPREVLKSIPGVHLVEMSHNRRWSRCCGGGALVVSAAYPEVSNFLSRQLLIEAANVGGDFLVTTCPHCYENLTSAARREKIDIIVRDFSEIISEAMGL